MVSAEAAAAILRTQGPMALALVAVILLLFAMFGAFVAYIRWSQSNTVPIAVHTLVCDNYGELAKEINNLRLEVAQMGAGR